ncbi:MAG: lytic murein transglycosylase, partial [Pseudolabrys sp.]
MTRIAPLTALTRRAFVAGTATLALGSAATAATGFAAWVEEFRPRAMRRGISEQTYNRVMGSLTPDTSVYALQRAQPE